MTTVRKGQSHGKVSREVFEERFRERFVDPLYDAERDAIDRIVEIAWKAYAASHKAPKVRLAGPGYADPSYELSIDWLATRARIEQAQARQRDPRSPLRVLIVNGSPRNDGTCPGEISKSFRLAEIVSRTCIDEAGTEPIEVDVLDLSTLTSEPLHTIHPCKSCVSTAMPLCHWPCSCYPNHALGQQSDGMAEIYERWARAHAVIVVTPVHWSQAPSVLKLMMDRLVCADGGNPDPTSTSGKDAAEAKAMEPGWTYPKHLAGRVFGLIVHGDASGIEPLKAALVDWLEHMGLVAAPPLGRLERFIGYYEPYATSHDALDRDRGLMEETRNVARVVVRATRDRRATSDAPRSSEAGLHEPRPK